MSTDFATTGNDSISQSSGNDFLVVSDTNQIQADDFFDGAAGFDAIVVTPVLPGVTGVNVDLTAVGTDATRGFHNYEGLGVSGASTVTLNAVQFGAGLISNSLVVAGGNGTVQAIFINNASNFSAAGFFFQDWEATDLITITGTAANNSITGSSQNDKLFGLDGNDTLLGGLGDDTLNGGGGIDTASYAGSGAGVTVSLALSGAQNTIGAGIDTLSAIENLTGSSFADTLSGNGGANTLNGGVGNDTLIGGAGADTQNGGDGNDIFKIAGNEALSDTFIGGAGTDKVQVTGAVAVTLAGFNTAASSIEQWQGNNQGVLGTTANNVFNFSVLTSKVGLPFVDGGAGNDAITGSKFADDLRGNVGTDGLNGGLGNDILTGGAGKDTQTGGAGLDRFDFNAIGESVKGINRDVITDFTRAQGDRIDLSTIDADIDGTAGNQAFKFISTQAFHGIDGELRCSGGIVQGDVNGDKLADFEIKVNLATLLSTDFIL